MNGTHDDEQARFFRERGFGLATGFGERPAVLVIDIMKAFSDATLPLGANLDDLSRIGAAWANVSLAHELTAPLSASLQKRFGMPTVAALPLP